ncbi:3'(2'),5'-bisphosphate nucleotidase CysQ [Dokdonella immobilis]|uniref:3'(2'),5'-bisphosphate nucleotidase CysQ n=1 Tax=Dokdonella immobilis TaxID=578942 RepID=A0A1I4ZEC1_9GAMM|nr:3'(2'),5'-bisphosphate nucleotidase CysQ [Dokdonella immobilis]SFN48383.1 3'(2'),5'-bisphosphate nucleotidase [Dokdonella immobilis]
MNLESLIPTLRSITLDAAAAILAVYGEDFDVGRKTDRSPLTEADLAAHRVIVDGLRRLTPELPILSEESAAIAWSERRTWSRYWLVDPLDGTREFVKRNGEFTVNIALIDGDRTVLGMVQAPVTGEFAWAWQGGGAWMAGPDERPRSCRTRRRRETLVVAGSRSHGDPRLAGMLERVGSYELTPLGSSLKFLRIASGEADLYVRLGPTSEWDTAAAQCVLEEAGGAVIDLHGQPLRYNRKDSLLNPEFIACGDPDQDWTRVLGTLPAG